ncbi:MAG TPA: hypothetical protein VN255_17545, partial [Mycobacterium sp.]|nr:hypothetical protein [Mycobacterium sp.]
MPRPAERVAVVGVMSRVDAWRCQWPTKRALAAAEGPVGPLLAVLVAEGATVLVVAPVVEDVPVRDVFFEHPAAATATITVAATATSNPGFTTHAFAVIRLSLQSLAITPRQAA